MKSNAERMDLAWKRLWTDHWFGRLFGGGLLLGLCGYVVQAIVSGTLTSLNVQSWLDYAQAVLQNWQDLTTPVPNLTEQFVSQATSSTLLTLFFSYLMAGITTYGAAVILRRCLDNKEQGWLGAAFGGFKYPFGMLWLFLRMLFIWFWWGLFLVIPPLGIWLLVVAFYRYRFIWLVKADHPDWGAGRCLKACREMMMGHKMDSFRLDCAYWKPLTLLLILMCVPCAGAAGLFAVSDALQVVVGFVAFMAFVAVFGAAIVITQYIRVGQGFLYRELADSDKS